MSRDPIFYVDEPSGLENAPTEKGWYHWDETWTQFEGPFDSEEAVREALDFYVREVLNGPGSKP